MAKQQASSSRGRGPVSGRGRGVVRSSASIQPQTLRQRTLEETLRYYVRENLVDETSSELSGDDGGDDDDGDEGSLIPDGQVHPPVRTQAT